MRDNPIYSFACFNVHDFCSHGLFPPSESANNNNNMLSSWMERITKSNTGVLFCFEFFSLDSCLGRSLSSLSLTVSQRSCSQEHAVAKIKQWLTGPRLAVLGSPKWLHICFCKNTTMKRAAHRTSGGALPSSVTITSAGCVTAQSGSASRGPTNSSCPFNHKIALLHQGCNSPVARSSPCLLHCQRNNLFRPSSKSKHGLLSNGPAG